MAEKQRRVPTNASELRIKMQMIQARAKQRTESRSPSENLPLQTIEDTTREQKPYVTSHSGDGKEGKVIYY